MRQEQRNLILLTIDAWRADFVDDFQGMALLPSLGPVAPWSLRCRNFYANAPWTTPALVSLLTGESPAKHGVFYQWSAPRQDSPAIAKSLAAQGYTVPSICYLNSINGYQNLGFAPCPIPETGESPGKAGTLLTALRQHRQQREPFFLWYHHTSLHFPYWPGEAYRRRLAIDDDAIPPHVRETICAEWNVPRSRFQFPLADRDIVRRLYAAEVLEFDDFLKPILDELLKDNLIDRTTFVLTADHADEHFEHGHVGHASTAEHATLYDEVLRTPLIVVDSRIAGPRSIDTRIQGMDLYSTLLGLAGAGPGAGTGAFDFSPAILDPHAPQPNADRLFYFHSARMGFRTPRENEGQIVEAISDGKTKVIAERYDTERLMRFDLASDPFERAPLSWRPGEESTLCRAAEAALAQTKESLSHA